MVMKKRPNRVWSVRRILVSSLLVGCLFSINALAQAAADAPAAARDGSHDFDFDLGVWRTDIVRRVHPLSGSDETVHMTGKVTVSKLWNGRAQVEEINADGPKGSHWDGMTVFLYDPENRQWSMNFAGASVGKMTPPTIGSLEDGRIQFIGTDTFDGRAVMIRAVWSDFTPTSHTYQESVSGDGGRTWVVYFTGHKTKLQ
jgi:hypothetical protein